MLVTVGKRVSKHPDDGRRSQVPALRRRLNDLDGDVAALGRLVGVDRTELGRWLNGRRPIPARHVDSVERVLALGDQGDDVDPVIVLGIQTATSALWAPVFDEAGRLGCFRWENREFARDAAGVLRAASWDDLTAAAVWPSWLDRNAGEGHPALWLDATLAEGDTATAPDPLVESERAAALRASATFTAVIDFIRSAVTQGEIRAAELRGELTPEKERAAFDERRPVENTNP